MTKSFNHLRQSMSPKARKMAAKKTQEMLKSTSKQESLESYCAATFETYLLEEKDT